MIILVILDIYKRENETINYFSYFRKRKPKKIKFTHLGDVIIIEKEQNIDSSYFHLKAW
jgi:hypothetical protein